MQREHHRELERTAGAPNSTRCAELGIGYPITSHASQCLPTELTRNSRWRGSGAIAPEGGPKYRLVGAGASLARPPEAGADWQSAAGRAANAISPANCRTSTEPLTMFSAFRLCHAIKATRHYSGQSQHAKSTFDPARTGAGGFGELRRPASVDFESDRFRNLYQIAHSERRWKNIACQPR